MNTEVLSNIRPGLCLDKKHLRSSWSQWYLAGVQLLIEGDLRADTPRRSGYDSQLGIALVGVINAKWTLLFPPSPTAVATPAPYWCCLEASRRVNTVKSCPLVVVWCQGNNSKATLVMITPAERALVTILNYFHHCTEFLYVTITFKAKLEPKELKMGQPRQSKASKPLNNTYSWTHTQ